MFVNAVQFKPKVRFKGNLETVTQSCLQVNTLLLENHATPVGGSIGQHLLHRSHSKHAIGSQTCHSRSLTSGRYLCSLTLVFDWSAVAFGVTALPADREKPV